MSPIKNNNKSAIVQQLPNRNNNKILYNKPSAVMKQSQHQIMAATRKVVDNNSTFIKLTSNLLVTIEDLQKQIQDFQNQDQPMEPQEKLFFKRSLTEKKVTGIIKSEVNKLKTNGKSSSILTTSGNTNSAASSASNPSNATVERITTSITFKSLQDQVQLALKLKKTFIARGGNAHIIRAALVRRGWVEKLHENYKEQVKKSLQKLFTYQISELVQLLHHEETGNLAARLIKSKLLPPGHQVDFYWGVFDDYYKDNIIRDVKPTLVSKFKRNIFSFNTKASLCEAVKISHWYRKEGVSGLNHPRAYNLATDAEQFWDDFHATACMSILKYVQHLNETKESRIISPSGKITCEVFEFAMNECCKIVKKLKNQDIDGDMMDATPLERQFFLDSFFRMVYFGNHFKLEDGWTEMILISRSNIMLSKLRPLFPYLDVDGYMNMWILKPIASSRGRGIHLCRTMNYISKLINGHESKFTAQKYIERPLLIYHTKFDIRQWFLISNSSPLTIWMYKECYLRFSSQTFNLRKLHESIHLTNNSVQAKYKNMQQDAALPTYNMWDSAQFCNYLQNIGHPRAFQEIIYPGMKENIIGATLVNRERAEMSEHAFELFGADFLLTTDLKPWLIEINSNPALGPTTPITSRLCPKVLEDLIKVVVDNKMNARSKTGNFELIYKERDANFTRIGDGLQVKGKPVKENYFFTPMDEIIAVEEKRDLLQKFTKEVKDIFTNFLKLVKQLQSF